MSHVTSRPISAPLDLGASTVTIRPVEAADAAGLVQFYETLSAASRRLRFLGASSGLTPATRGHGVRTVHATSFADNARVLRLLTSAPGASTRLCGSGIVDVEIPLSQRVEKD